MAAWCNGDVLVLITQVMVLINFVSLTLYIDESGHVRYQTHCCHCMGCHCLVGTTNHSRLCTAMSEQVSTWMGDQKSASRQTILENNQ